ncbi:MAG TPA: Orn/Lys/Arg decarboxylase N-terminal domain-containing protein [Candidatus Sabulitectum sp.]|nr:Orn/Lys/Arg decarboxylase N-terminal domain-containing protein [Candidatus Sabulitectum sp.]
MELIEKKDWPVLLVDYRLEKDNSAGVRIKAVKDKLETRLDCAVMGSPACDDAVKIIAARPDLGCLVVNWDNETVDDVSPGDLVGLVRKRNSEVPILVMTDKSSITDISADVLKEIDGYIWLDEDTPSFIAGRIDRELTKYIKGIMPPFFNGLVRYAEEYRYSWHTPGHMGGLAFLRHPVGIACHKFFGENLFRSDLSVSVADLGSLLDHSGVVGDSEREAARVFQADETFFVTGGNSMANQIVWRARVSKGDVVLVDRNCHKSINYAMIDTGAIPVYMKPARNPYGTIGPVNMKEMEPAAVRKKIADSPLIQGKKARVKMAVVTNSTYDGLCYNVNRIMEKLGPHVDNIHFDEAWFAYAAFHPLYEGYYAMTPNVKEGQHPPVFATQSTHKLLAALSQASMIHVRNGSEEVVDRELFNEAFMMYSSTSPQYSIIATLDVSTRMMKGSGGRTLMDETIEEPVVFRKKMVQIGREIARTTPEPEKRWWFSVWQPEKTDHKGKKVPLDSLDNQKLINDRNCWMLKPGQKWHLFENINRDQIMLDPQKVTIATPGIDFRGKHQEVGIPASVVTAFLRDRGIVVEKTGYYSWLCLFSMGTSRGKSGTLLAELFTFKKHYDDNSDVEVVIPSLPEAYPEEYLERGIRSLCDDMHSHIVSGGLVDMMLGSFDQLPEQVMTPAEAYSHVVKGTIEWVPLAECEGRIPCVMVVPYPPGIPIIMPGERFTPGGGPVLEYLTALEDFEARFPGFECDIHGIRKQMEQDGRKRFRIPCIQT